MINGGDNNVDDDAPDEPCPGRREVLTATALLKRYIDLEHDPLTRKLDALLDSFKYNLHLEEPRSMKPTEITSYFGRI